MDMVKSGLNLEICLIYLDVIIVFSKDISDHFNRICLIDRLKGATLKLKPSKCKLLQCKVRFMGYIMFENAMET